MSGAAERSAPDANPSSSGPNEGGNDPQQPSGDPNQGDPRRGRYFNRRRRPLRPRRFGGPRPQGSEPRDPNEKNDPSSPQGENEAADAAGSQQSSGENQEPRPFPQGDVPASEVASWREDAEQIEREHRKKLLGESSEPSSETAPGEALEEQSPSETNRESAQGEPGDQPVEPVQPPPQPRDGGNRFQRPDRGPRDQRPPPQRPENREQRPQGQHPQRERPRTPEQNRNQPRDRNREGDRGERGDRPERPERGDRREGREQREVAVWNNYQFKHPGLQELKTHVDKIRGGLEIVLKDLDKMLDILAKAEQESEIDEDEIEILRQQIKKIQR